MLFHTNSFFAFFLAVFVVFWSLPKQQWRLWWILIASCAFYMSWNPWFIALILFSTSIDYLAARMIDGTGSQRWRRGWLLGSIAVNLGILSVFKYANFFLQTVHSTAGCFGLPLPIGTLQVLVPLGISFYTFEAISYVVDVYRKKRAALRSPLDYGVYILFFPHLIAGPIVRSHDFLPQLHRLRKLSAPRVLLGVRLFLFGLFQKVALADNLAALVDPVFAHPADYESLSIWLALLSYTIQIYCDFAGYSSMAIGLAHLLGFRLPQNFNRPYLAASLGEFWRRWHITLGTWMRDYLFIPLGGSRGGTLATCRNLLVTFALCGLWHGASWNYIVWGFSHGVILCGERLARLPAWAGQRALRPLFVLWTFFLINLTMVFVRAQSLTDACVVYGRLFRFAGGQALSRELLVAGTVGVAGVLGVMVLSEAIRWRRLALRLPSPLQGALLASVIVAVMLLWPEDNKQFIYFQF
ncbi:MAG TPA: MBOAT family protein [Gemmataceae bacterium]|jgi:alginate O-acetyltransferase complex protein AlgI|nr:MBOAT family protein [Gemmataceae bacterium]